MANETVEAPTVVEEEPKFDAAAFIKARNEGKPTPAPGKPAEPAAKVEEPKPAAAKAEAPAKDEDDPEGPHVSRSQRREMNRLREAAAEERGRRMAIEEFIAKGFNPTQAAAAAKVEANAEPTREQFKTDAEFTKALATWQTRDVIAKETARAADLDDYNSEIVEANAKFAEDVRLFPDFEEVTGQIDDIKITRPEFNVMFVKSTQRAALAYYFGSHREEFKALLALPFGKMVEKFHRLEGKLEFEYNSPKAAQASAPTKDAKTAPTPEKPAQGGKTAAERDFGKPRPSTEVVARGGAATPDEPKPGTAAWMARRNQAQFGR